jgi:hypothetical protein
MRSSREVGPGSGTGRAVDHLQSEGVTALGELQADGMHGGRGPMLDGEREIVAVAAEVGLESPQA